MRGRESLHARTISSSMWVVTFAVNSTKTGEGV
jgi:hypothetical protein